MNFFYNFHHFNSFVLAIMWCTLVNRSPPVARWQSSIYHNKVRYIRSSNLKVRNDLKLRSRLVMCPAWQKSTVENWAICHNSWHRSARLLRGDFWLPKKECLALQPALPSTQTRLKVRDDTNLRKSWFYARWFGPQHYRAMSQWRL